MNASKPNSSSKSQNNRDLLPALLGEYLNCEYHTSVQGCLMPGNVLENIIEMNFVSLDGDTRGVYLI